ncbi:MAG: hypothetical protein WC389_12735 [Lutibacter sp.]|jgi:hypothetical protein
MNQNSDVNEKIIYNFDKHSNNANQKLSIANLGWNEENTIPSIALIKLKSHLFSYKNTYLYFKKNHNCQ